MPVCIHAYIPLCLFICRGLIVQISIRLTDPKLYQGRVIFS